MTGSRSGRSPAWYLKLDLSGDDAPSTIRHQVQQQAGIDPGPGGGTLLTASVLVINQRDKLVEVSNDYDIYDGDGGRLGRVVQVGQSGVAKLVRLLGSNDQFKTVRLEVHDVDGRPVLLLTRPAKVVRSRMLVQRPDGTDVGEIRQENFFGKTRFGFLAVGNGSVASGWRTGGRGRSRSPTTTTSRSRGSPRPGRAWSRRCSAPRTTTWYRFTGRSRNRWRA